MSSNRGSKQEEPYGSRGSSKEKADTKSSKDKFVKGTAIKISADEEGLIDIFKHPLNLMLVFFPLGICAHYLHWSVLYRFWFNFLAMVPLAKILGDATEELAASLKNDMVAGLLNATFGNAVEVVIMIASLHRGMIRIVKTSLLGSVLSNTLLVLGMSFLFGGLFSLKRGVQAAPNNARASMQRADGAKTSTASTMQISIDEKIQSFSLLGALVNTSMMLVSCLAFSLVTVFRMVLVQGQTDVDAVNNDILLPVSRISSVIIILAYIAYILFQLVTHSAAMSEDAEEEDEEGHHHLSICMSMTLLFATTAIVAFISEILVHAIEGVTEGAHISEHFIGIILLPIVGNACEHAAAVRFAVQDKLGLSVGIAVGSSTQIALFVVPLSVICGWIMGQPMDLNFGSLNSSLITLSVIVVLSMVVDGQSNWLQGYLLCSVYAIICVMYWNLPNVVNDGTADNIAGAKL
jgi:Ca2+:H+ antiporter